MMAKKDERLTIRERIALKIGLFLLKIMKVEDWSDKEWHEAWHKEIKEMLQE